MRVKKVTRYYCDYCKRSYGRIDSITRHERGCTSNPNRICGVCEVIGLSQRPMSELQAILKTCVPKSNDPYAASIDIQPLRDATENCPACILAALRQNGGVFAYEFSFKEEMATMWKQYNDDKRDKHGY